jgi:small subunit ribosomal protein S20
MPNIEQQKKRVRSPCASGREHPLPSTVKTLTKRPGPRQSGEADTIAAEHRTLVRWVDRAASKGALHANTAARKKAQAARLVAGGSS